MPPMPPLESGAYLVSYLLEIGPVLSGAMGAAPLSYGEIDAWCNRIGIDLQPWESRLLCRLSREYLNESQRATKLGIQPPWIAEGMKPEATAAQIALRALSRDL